MKNLLKTFALFLVLAIMAGCSQTAFETVEEAATSDADIQQIEESRSSEPYIGKLTTISGDNSSITAPLGYTKIPVDLNKGAGGKYVYLCYKRSAVPIITSIKGFTATTLNIPPAQIPEGHTGFGGNCNEGIAFHERVYLAASTSRDYGLPITDVDVIYGSSPYVSRSGWTKVGQNLNADVGGDYIYVVFKRVTDPTVDLFKVGPNYVGSDYEVRGYISDSTIKLQGTSNYANNFFISVQECDSNRSAFGPEYSVWTNINYQNPSNELVDFDIRTIIPSGFLKKEHYYRVKLACSSPWKEDVVMMVMC